MSIVTQLQGGVMTLHIDRPARKNALTAAMYSDLASALLHASDIPQIQVVVIRGHEAFFTAGNDIDDFIKHPPVGMDSPVVHFLHALARFDKPLIAAVCGPAIGIGTTLLLHCDLVYAADNARFAMPFVQLGLCPEAASSYLLPALCGYQRAAEKLLFGEVFLADEAQAMGLVNEILPAQDVLARAQSRALALTRLPAQAVAITRQLLKKSQRTRVATAINAEVEHFGVLLKSDHAQEAFTAFLEKRPPQFNN